MPSPIVWPLTLTQALGEPSNCKCEGEKQKCRAVCPNMRATFNRCEEVRPTA